MGLRKGVAKVSRCWLLGGMILPGLLVWHGALNSLRAQPVGTCLPAGAEAYLDVNNVRARIFNDGGLFWQGGPYAYEVPQGAGVHAVFAASLWIGGMAGDELRMAGTRYGPYEFWPGPLDASGAPAADCTRYDHLFAITRADVERYNETGVPAQNLLDWPGHWGAPVLDGDGVASNYNLDGGDRPALVDDQMLWWVMQDAGNEHAFTGAPPLRMEVQGSAFAFQSGNALGNTTFYRYRLVYHGDVPLRDTYVGFYVDPDLGDFADDYIGTDTTLHLGYVYNGDNDDGPEGYGPNPPAVGFTFLRGARAPVDGLDNDRDGLVDEGVRQSAPVHVLPPTRLP